MSTAAPTRDEAQRRADQIRAFQAELSALSSEGIELTAEERIAIAAHHDALLVSLASRFDIDRTEGARRMSLGMRFASAFGAAALTAAVVSFFYRIWGSLSTPAQVVLVTAAPLAAFGAMVVAARRERTLYVASLCAIVACGAFVLQSFLLGELFNMRSSPHTLVAWAAFGLAVSLPFRLGLPFAGAIACLIAYVAALGFSTSRAPWDEFFEWPETAFVPSVLAYMAWRWAPRELQAWARATALAVGLLAVLLVAHSNPDTLLPLSPSTVGRVYQGAAALLAVLVIALGVRRGRSETLIVGALFAAFFLLGRFLDWWWNWMPKYLFFLIVGSTCLAWLWMLGTLRRRAAQVPA